MIRLSISYFIFFYALCSVVALLILWVMAAYKDRKPSDTMKTEGVWKCSVCSNTYIDSRNDAISQCPLCGSYNKKEEDAS